MANRRGKSRRKKNINPPSAGGRSISRAVWITAGATVLAAIITVVLARLLGTDGGGLDKPHVVVIPTVPKSVSAEIPFFLELDDPIVVWPKMQGSEYGYTKPPKIQIVGRSSNPLTEDAMCAQCGKASLYEGPSLPEVCDEAKNCELGLSSRRLITIFDSGAFIRSEHPKAPHGQYRGVFKLVDQIRPENRSKSFSFNYVYQEDFRDLMKALSPKMGEFTHISGIFAGLQITNLTVDRRFVYAYLNQEFDFKSDFCIVGFFTMESESRSNPCSFDISFCDKWGEKLSVIFADGPLNAFTIKMAGEEYGEEGMTNRSEKIRIALSTGNDVVKNFFKIRFWQHEKQTRCSLYLRHNSPVLKCDSPVHERVVNPSVFLQHFTRIHFKLWKVGVIKLYNLEVAEEGKDRES